MDSELRKSLLHILTWLLYAAAGFGALSYGFFLRTKRSLRTFEEMHGLLSSMTLNPRDVLLQKQHGIEALRGLAIVIMLVGFLFWPLLILGVFLFFFQTNAWKSTQRDLFSLDRDHPEHKSAQLQHLAALGAEERTERQRLERRGSMWQRVFAITMGLALIIACSLLTISVSWF